MRKINLLALLLVMLFISGQVLSQEQDGKYKAIFTSKGQKIALISGDITKLAGVTAFNAIVNNEKIKLGIKGEDDSIYISRKVQEMNAKKEGKGDEWLQEWKTSLSLFLPAFIEGYEDEAKSFVPKISEGETGNSATNCTMVLQNDWVYYTWQGSPNQVMTLNFISPTNKNDTIVKLLFNTIYGYNSKKYHGQMMGLFFTTGKVLAKYFNKDVYKPK